MTGIAGLFRLDEPMMTKLFDNAAGSRRAAAILLLAAGIGGGLAGCGTMGQMAPAVPPAAIPAGPAGSWYSPPAEYPGICMTLAPDGALWFAGGYAFFNPGRWSFDNASAELRLELGGKAPLPAIAQATRQQGDHKLQGTLLRTDEASRTLVYRVTPETEAIDIGGFVFYRKPGCGAKADQR
jgi:hypothetical protein